MRGPGPLVDIPSATSVLQELGLPVTSQYAAAADGQGDLPSAVRVLQDGIGPTMPALEAFAVAKSVLQEEASVKAVASGDSQGKGDLPGATSVPQEEATEGVAAFGDSQGPSYSL
jgi:hypothetical protein